MLAVVTWLLSSYIGYYYIFLTPWSENLSRLFRRPYPPHEIRLTMKKREKTGILKRICRQWEGVLNQNRWRREMGNFRPRAAVRSVLEAKIPDEHA